MYCSGALLLVHLTAGPGRHRVTDSVVMGGALSVEVLLVFLLIEDGALPILLGVALVLVHGGAVLVQQILALLLVLLKLILDRVTFLLVDSVALFLSLVLHLELLHFPALSRWFRPTLVLLLRLVMGLVMRL